VLSDELNHASIIDGCRLSRSALAVYRHRDMDHLQRLLAEGAGDETREAEGSRASASMPTIVVTDSVFSMDGDVAPLDDLLALCDRYDALLVLDEAHAVLGPDLPEATGRRDGGGGIGGRDRAGVQRRTVVRVGTLSKTLGSLGGFVAGSRDVVDLMVNRARSYIFSTAPTPADAAAALAALHIVRSAEGAALRGRLAGLIVRLAEAGLAPPDHPSPIIPVVLGSEEAALTASAALLQEGLWVPAIRPPTVPVGTSRLRVTLSAAHSDEDVTRLVQALRRLAPSLPPPQSSQQPQPPHAAPHPTSARVTL
jgi:7-keto-8-aminopelargonate synthetase-like enzyme